MHTSRLCCTIGRQCQYPCPPWDKTCRIWQHIEHSDWRQGSNDDGRTSTLHLVLCLAVETAATRKEPDFSPHHFTLPWLAGWVNPKNMSAAITSQVWPGWNDSNIINVWCSLNSSTESCSGHQQTILGTACMNKTGHRRACLQGQKCQAKHVSKTCVHIWQHAVCSVPCSVQEQCLSTEPWQSVKTQCVLQ